ncbi:hypothetical protein QLQ12_02315 [Actinoplanes sp. NEAU-A12]|uniref:Uncharacterized protein n=1 Tax=Actinoplanes sandaracinus TaxID=3045177 RepID=A0ABT6WCH2_9ACTN|nr:hypothetical protein [Actinoplanes sandaracinus]MDI6097432.1 hypothetical protein [Actinoplanes sandaracinus]
MPVSRKRKKSQKSAAAARAERRREHARQVRLAQSLRDLDVNWEQGRVRRIELARPHAVELAGRLMSSPRTGTTLEDELCAALGPLLTRLGDLPADGGYVGPDHLAAALADVLREEAAENQVGARALAALAAVLPAPLRERTGLTVADPGVPGEVRWTRDRYGSRFAVVAPFATPEGPVRWYLWDVDACGFTPLPVHTGFYASPEEALAAWQVGVGALAAGGTSWRRIDDSLLLADLLPKPEDLGALGGESAEQHAEYHRCRRLAQVVLGLPSVLSFGTSKTALDAGPERFAAWWRDHADGPEPANLDDMIEDLFDAWPRIVPDLFDTCSPHRVESVAQQLRDELREEAGGVLALLPAWVTWLSGRTGLPAELRERALARIGETTGENSAIHARVVE